LTYFARWLSRSGTIAAGMPTMRRPACDFGGPSTNGPIDRSMYAARIRTVRAFRSRSARVSAETSPHRRLANVARSTSARNLPSWVL
jgi:hypothetical protein